MSAGPEQPPPTRPGGTPDVTRPVGATGTPPSPLAMPSAAEAGRQLARDMGQGLAEVGVWTLAVVVVVGGLGLLGHLVAGVVGVLVGVAVGVVALGVTWVVLLVAGVSLAAKLFGRRGRG